MTCLSRTPQPLLVFVLVALGPWSQPARAEEAPSAWHVVQVPQAWSKAPKGRYSRAVFTHWYRCAVEVPRGWKGRPLTLFVEGVDDAREVYFNGRLVGRLGSFPPRYRSGLGQSPRLKIPAEAVRYGRINWVALRVHHREGRLGFNVAAPVLFAPPEAIRLQGPWQARMGDDPSWATGGDPPQQVVYRKAISAQVAEQTLRKLAGEDGPLPVAETLRRMKTPDDLVVEACLSEPVVGQPLCVKFDARGRLWVMEYRQYPNPAGLKPLSRDKHLRTVYDRVPPPPPKRTPGRDRISIHEDTDGDGRYDRHRVFLDNLNIATAFEFGRDGLWVLNPPYLLFYPDRDHDDRPDGPPEVHLEGFGLEDTHSVVNSLTWGPDGWLYAAQGSTVSGDVRRWGSKDKPVHSMGQLIWRYHPRRRVYEIFAEGGGNAFGVEIDAKGRIFSGHNGGNTRGFHYIQGGYYQKGFGKHGSLSNPYAFGYFGYMPHGNVPRFTHDFVIYESTELPARYHGRLFAVAPLQSRVVISRREPQGSTFRTADEGFAFQCSDTWVRPVDAALGPDGAVYICDFYEQRIDHAAHFQGRVTPDSGRVYRIRAPGLWKPPSRFDLSRVEPEELLRYLEHPNRWFRRRALQQLAYRQPRQLLPRLRKSLPQAKGQTALEYLWAIHLLGGLDEPLVLACLKHPDPYVRLWAVRLACDDGRVGPKLAAVLARLAGEEKHVEVRNQLACSARRLPPRQALPVAAALLGHDEDVQDPYQGLALWWLVERQISRQPEAVLAWLEEHPELWRRPLMQRFLTQRLMRRFAQPGTRRDLLRAARLLRMAPDRSTARAMMQGFEEAFQGRSLAGLPDQLLDAIAAAGGLSLELRIRRGDAQAVQEALRLVRQAKTSSRRAVALIEVLGEVHPPQAKEPLLQLALKHPDAKRRTAALAALQGYADPGIAQRLLAHLKQMPPEVQTAAFSLLADRAVWTLAVLRAVEAGQLEKKRVPQRFLRRALLHRRQEITALVEAHWGKLQGATTQAMYQQIARLKRVIEAADGNPYAGKELFAQHCGKCHRLFDEGGHIGPDLTAFQRTDLDRMLLNIVNPSAEIREGYENYLVLTDDGRTLTGFIEDKDEQLVVLKDAEGRRHLIPREQIEQMAPLAQSLMPQGLLDPLSDQQVRDLFAYLRSSQPLP